MTHEELLEKIKSLEKIMQAQGLMFASHQITCHAFQEIIKQKLELE